MKKQMKKLLVCLMVAVVITVAANAILPLGEQKVYDSIIRLHILANSDTAGDQSVKYMVRDAMLEKAEKIFENENIDQAKITVSEYRDRLKEIALEVLEENGFDYGVDIILGTENYPTREYDGISFPAGDYYSLRVVLGEGGGQNWWCVLFPPLCIGSSAMKEKLEEADFSEDEVKVFTETEEKPRFKFKFKILEWFS